MMTDFPHRELGQVGVPEPRGLHHLQHLQLRAPRQLLQDGLVAHEELDGGEVVAGGESPAEGGHLPGVGGVEGVGRVLGLGGGQGVRGEGQV